MVEAGIWNAQDIEFGTTVLAQGPDITMVLTRGKSVVVALHVHDSHDEFGTLLDGSGTLSIDGVRRNVVPGSTWAIPRGVPHGGQYDGEFAVVVWFTPGDDLSAPDRRPWPS